MIRMVVIVGLVGGFACSSEPAATVQDAQEQPAKASPKIVVVSRALSMNDAPCEQCHQHVQDFEQRKVKAHPEIRVKHMPDAQCNTCHDPAQPSALKLASGQSVPLQTPHILCGQCHAKETADWSLGIHGKQVGNWQSEIHRFSCTRCHDAHKPAFGSMQAVPPPPFPRMGIPKGAH